MKIDQEAWELAKAQVLRNFDRIDNGQTPEEFLSDRLDDVARIAQVEKKRLLTTISDLAEKLL